MADVTQLPPAVIAVKSENFTYSLGEGEDKLTLAFAFQAGPKQLDQKQKFAQLLKTAADELSASLQLGVAGQA